MRSDGGDSSDFGAGSMHAAYESDEVVGESLTIGCLNIFVDTRDLSVCDHDVHGAVVFLVGFGQRSIVVNCGSDAEASYQTEAARFAHVLSLRIRKWISKLAAS